MPNLNYNLKTMVRGDTYKIRVNVVDDLGAPVNIENRSIYFTMKRQLPDADDVAPIQIANQLIGIDSQNGVANIVVPAALTSTLEATNYWYDIQLVKDNEEVRTILRGRILVEMDVTRTTNVSDNINLTVVETYTYNNFTVESA